MIHLCLCFFSILRFVVVVAAQRMSLSFPGMKDLAVSLDEPTVGELHTVHVWGDACEAVDVGEEAANWLSRVLDMVHAAPYMWCVCCERFSLANLHVSA